MIAGVAPNDVLTWQWEGFLNTPLLWNDTRTFSLPQFPLSKINSPGKYNGTAISPHLILGKRSEIFFRYYLENFTQEEILIFNEQISSEKITIGEVDFLLRNKNTKAVTHVELVFKFYLYDPSFSSEKNRWIGPNRKDTLLRKVRRIKEHQFPLIFRKESEPLLEQLKISPEEIRQKVCFKGNLFVPYDLRHNKVQLLNNDCIKGFWIKFSEFTADQFGPFQFFSPKKQNWSIDPSHGSVWYSYTEIKEQVSVLLEKHRSPLVWMKKNEEEYLQFFLVWW